MSEKKMFQQPDWFRLDNAGILFPGQNTNKWSNIFRVSIELKEEIDPDILKQAVKNILPRFPSFNVRMRKGLFWYYLEKNPVKEPSVNPDIQNPCYRVNFKESDSSFSEFTITELTLPLTFSTQFQTVTVTHILYVHS